MLWAEPAHVCQCRDCAAELAVMTTALVDVEPSVVSELSRLSVFLPCCCKPKRIPWAHMWPLSKSWWFLHSGWFVLVPVPRISYSHGPDHAMVPGGPYVFMFCILVPTACLGPGMRFSSDNEPRAVWWVGICTKQLIYGCSTSGAEGLGVYRYFLQPFTTPPDFINYFAWLRKQGHLWNQVV